MRRDVRERGFTIVELMVSITITSVVVAALYTVANSATETFNQQQRAAEMQLRLRFAVEQLRADISRAGYMSTPNSNTDPNVCPRPTSTTATTQPFQAIEITRDTTASTLIPNTTDNQFITPTILRLTGNYASVDEYTVAGIVGSTISLQNQTPQWARVDSAAEFNRIFIGATGTRRLLRITSPSGQTQFVQILGGSWQSSSSATLPTLNVSPAPTLIGDATGGGATGCGIAGLGVGATVAPVTQVEYRLGNLRTTFPELYPTDPTEAAAKTDLVRREYEIGSSTAFNTRIVGEYAVDFDLTLARDEGGPGGVTMRSYSFGDSQITTQVGSIVTLGLTARPESVRSVTARLSVRDRVQDPAFGWVARANATYPLTRFRVNTSLQGASRVRTLVTEVTLPNLAARNLR